MSSNPYAPYPAWFKRYGSPDMLDKWPYGESFREGLVQAIKRHKELLKNMKVVCGNCGRDYYTMRPDKGTCPFCKAPKNYNAEEMGWFLT